MAKELTTKELKTKEPRKKGRRLKKTVRKTLGTICLVSAILVASIPTEGLKHVAAEDRMHDKLTAEKMEDYFKIPELKEDTKIYTTGDGKFQFAYVTPEGSETGPQKIAVILGYSDVGALENGTLIIPDQVDAYLNYSTTEGTGEGYVAVGSKGNYLFYRTETEVPAEPDMSEDVSDPDPKVETIVSYHPCFYSDYDKWSGEETLYYYETADFKPNGTKDEEPKPATAETHRRIQNITVSYIGNQYLATDSQGGWKIAGVITNPQNGIFAEKGAIRELIVGNNLSGIGNYAFYGCTAMRSITLSNALNTIGNYAFAGCLNMNTVNLNSASNITAIGAHAFEKCEALASFTVPINVQAIGDAAFMDCWAMTSIELCGGPNSNVALQTLGCDMFVNCRQLQSVTFPRSFTEDVDISNFQGCLALQSITVGNTNMNITEGFGSGAAAATFGYEAFRQQYTDSTIIHGTFYFEGPTNASNPSTLHKTAKEHYFAFSYLHESNLEKQDIYELTVNAGTESAKKKATYRVNSSNMLIGTELENNITTIDLPEFIGPYYIRTIDSDVFQDYCFVTSLTIPATVEQIRTDAFSGCHRLKYVCFENPINLTIDNGAFRTQYVRRHKCGSSALDPNPELTFVGPVSLSSQPFLYAMNEENKISVGDQPDSYITYFSGWPTGLKVRRNPDTHKNELRDYPTLGDLKNPVSSDLYKIYSDIDPETAEKYKDAMSGARSKMTAQADSSSVTGYEKQIWDAVMNIDLPAGIEGIEEGLFKKKEVDSLEEMDDFFQHKVYKTLTAHGLKEVAGDDDPDDGVDSGCFANCTTFGSIALYGDTESIGDYAFKNCKNLQNVTLPDTVTEMGRIPFTGCSELSHVDFQGSTHFNCDNSIIYQLDSAGQKWKIIEYLEGRSSGSVTAAEVDGVRAIAEEAFKDTKVSFVDLSSSSVEQIPAKAFENCEKLIQVILPDSLRSVEDQAFTKCPNLQRIQVPNVYTVFRVDALDTSGEYRPDDLVFVCNEESLAAEYAKTYHFEIDPNGMEIKYKVEWKDWDGTELKTEYVIQGQDAVPPKEEGKDPTVPGHRPGYDFVGWSEEYTGISKDMVIYAMYETEDPEAKKVDVIFYDDDQTTVLYTRRVTIGQVVELPADPVKEGYVFVGWIGDVKAPITQATSFYAKWEEIDGRFVVRFIDYDGTVLNQQLVEPGEDAYEPKTPERQGYTFASWVPSDFTKVSKDLDIYATYVKDDGSSGDDDNPGGSDDDNNFGNGDEKGKFYTLTVQNGSGSGSYLAGSQPVIVANDPPSGQEFSHWTIEPSTTKIASTAVSATVVTMPESNVTVTAHYKAKSGGSLNSNGSVSGNLQNNNSNRPNSNSGAGSTGSTVVIDKNGLSNTGVVSATVKGSSDNFTIKITESSSASEAIVKALQAEYGDISSIKYFPMDISLYDSTGTRKISDTTGLSISITLPLPDSLITYAGNNKVGCVNSSGKLEKLSPRFTTIDGVACVTFTAEHFSPYVIYVDTDNLSASVVVDNTPKTGDGIHPKWFLSIGLACMAVVLFMKRDKRSLQVAKAV